MSKNCPNIKVQEESSDTVGESSGEDTDHRDYLCICNDSKEKNLSDLDEVKVNKVETVETDKIISKEIDKNHQLNKSENRDNQIQFDIFAVKQKKEKVKLKVAGQRSKKPTLARQWRLLKEKERRTTDKQSRNNARVRELDSCKKNMGLCKFFGKATASIWCFCRRTAEPTV